MDTPLYVFEPNQTEAYLTLGILLAIFAGAAFALFWLGRKEPSYENRNRRRLVNMLLYFVLLIAGSAAIFTLVDINRLQPIKIYADRLETSYGEVAIEQLQRANLFQNDQRSFVSPDIETSSSLLLYIEESNKRSYVFSNKNYDVRGIINVLRPMMDAEEDAGF